MWVGVRQTEMLPGDLTRRAALLVGGQVDDRSVNQRRHIAQVHLQPGNVLVVQASCHYHAVQPTGLPIAGSLAGSAAAEAMTAAPHPAVMAVACTITPRAPISSSQRALAILESHKPAIWLRTDASYES